MEILNRGLIAGFLFSQMNSLKFVLVAARVCIITIIIILINTAHESPKEKIYYLHTVREERKK